MSQNGGDRASGSPPPCYRRPAWWVGVGVLVFAVAWLLYTFGSGPQPPAPVAVGLMVAIVVVVAASYHFDRPASRARKAAKRDGGRGGS